MQHDAHFISLHCEVWNYKFISVDTSCERCYTSYYCLGDGESHTCGRCENDTTACERSPTEHTFGAASECSTCPKGWVIKYQQYTVSINFSSFAESNKKFISD